MVMEVYIWYWFLNCVNEICKFNLVVEIFSICVFGVDGIVVRVIYVFLCVFYFGVWYIMDVLECKFNILKVFCVESGKFVVWSRNIVVGVLGISWVFCCVSCLCCWSLCIKF